MKDDVRAQNPERMLDILQWILIGSAVVLMFLGRGRHRHWLMLALTLPVLRFVFSSAYRSYCTNAFRHAWAEFLQYHDAGAPVPWRSLFHFVICPIAVFYLASGNVPGVANGDTTPVVPTAIRFVRHGDFRLDEYVGDARSSLAAPSREDLPYYLRATPRGVYSNYPAGMTTFAIPVAAISNLLGADWHRPAVAGRIEKWTGAWLAAMSVGLFCLICLRLSPPAPAVMCAGLVALASSVFSTNSQDLSQQGGVVFWVLLILWIEVNSSGRPSIPGTVLQGIACGLAPTCRVSAVLLVGVFLAWVLLRSPRRAIVTGLVALLAFAPWGMFYWLVYHSLLGPTEGQAVASAWSHVPGQYLPGVLFSPGRGLFVYHPWLIVLGLIGFFPRPCVQLSLRGWRIFLLAACLLHLLLVASWRVWWGGDSWGPRLMTETVPLLALLALPVMAWCWKSRPTRSGLIVLGIAGLWMHMAGTYFDGLKWNAIPNSVDEHPERLWDWNRPPFLYPVLRPHR